MPNAMKKILVPVDFSAPSLEAVKFAMNLCAKSKGEVRLIHIVELPVLYDSTLMPALSFEEVFYNEMKEKAEKNFEKIITKWSKEGLKISKQVEFGHFITKLMVAAEAWKADVLVMGTHGSSGVREFVIGSNTEKVVRYSDIPVMVIRKATKIENLNSIVFAMPSIGENDEIMNELKKLQDFLKAQLHLVYINTPAIFRKDAHTLPELKAFAKRYMLKNYTVNVFNDLNEEDGLKNFAESKKAGLVAMITHGRKGIAHLFAGSITEDVVNHLQIPVWTYRIK
jgi:nucleotide-binding universal stress UspA family protein